MAYLRHAQKGLRIYINNANVPLQNALKIFEHMPKNLMDIVKKTDPSTVTQHGLYMRPLSDPSLHPLVAKATPAEAPDTPPNEEEQKAGSLAASNSPDTVVAATVKELVKHSEDCGQPAAQETKRAGAVPTSSVSTQATRGAVADAVSCPVNTLATPGKQSDDTSDIGVPCSAEVPGPSAEINYLSLPVGTPSVSKGSLTGSVGISSTPMGPSTPVQNPPGNKDNSSATAPDTSARDDACPGKGAESPAGWGRGRVSLLGDAAHATIPNGVWRLLLVTRLHLASCKAACSSAYDDTCVHAAKPCGRNTCKGVHADAMFNACIRPVML